MFKKLVTKVGLESSNKYALVVRGTPLGDKVEALAAELGPYPHAALARVSREATKGKGWPRFKSVNEEAYKVLVSPKMLEAHGAPMDPWGDTMVPNGEE